LGTGTTLPELLLPSEIALVHTVGGAPATQVVQLQNSGLAPLLMSSISISGAGFTLSHDCPASLSPGGVCRLNLGFSASAPGDTSGALTVVSNAPGGSRVIPLRGIAQPRAVPLLEVLPFEIGFGSRAMGTTTPAQIVKLRNLGGVPVVFDSFVVSPDFVILGNRCPAQLDSLATCEADVAMRPTGYGIRRGTFTIRSNAENGPNSVRLTGTGCRFSGLTLGRLGISTGCGP
jgi:hypothetical protein